MYACGEDEWLSRRAFEHENNKAVTGIEGGSVRMKDEARRWD